MKLCFCKQLAGFTIAIGEALWHAQDAVFGGRIRLDAAANEIEYR